MSALRHVLPALLLLLGAAPAAAQGFTVHGPDSSRLTLGGRVQTIFDTSSEEGVPATATTIRRARLDASVVVSPLLSARIQPEVAGDRLSVKDVYVQLSFHPSLHLVAGQMHRPFGTVVPTSAMRIVPVERGVRIRGVQGALEHNNLLVGLGHADRDVGLLARGPLPGGRLGLGYSVGLFDGPARRVAPTENTFQAVARLDARPSAWARGGVSWSRRDFAQGDGAETILLRGGQAVAADLELGAADGGPRLVAEAAYGDFDPFATARFASAQGWLSWRTGRISAAVAGVEPLLRVSWADPDARGPALPAAVGGTLVTPGVNLWLGGRNRVAFNLDLWNDENGRSAQSGKVLFQVGF
jgi:hypothetical protein